MNVLVINCGSSSLKYQLIDSLSEEVLAKGICERIGIDGRLVYQKKGGEKEITESPMPTHKEAIKLVLEALVNPKSGAVGALSEIAAVGHRIVHGGETFAASVVLTGEVLEKVEECNELAPLHNPANLIGIRACQELMPQVPMVGVFDTAFHQTMPKKAYLYGLPYEYYEKYKVRRYGFHGTSHSYVSRHCASFLQMDPKNSKIIVAHLGNGASVSAVLNGECVDTSMGLSFSLDWKPCKAENDAELDTVELEQILLRDRALLTMEDIEKVAAHFRSKIRMEKQRFRGCFLESIM